MAPTLRRGNDHETTVVGRELPVVAGCNRPKAVIGFLPNSRLSGFFQKRFAIVLRLREGEQTSEAKSSGIWMRFPRLGSVVRSAQESGRRF